LGQFVLGATEWQKLRKKDETAVPGSLYASAR